MQETRTDRAGAFVLHGLVGGWYQIDAIAPGLIVVPESTVTFGSDVGLTGARGVIGRAGGPAVDVRVAAVASVAIRVTDATSGGTLPHASVLYSIPEGLEPVMRSPSSMNSEVVLANGRKYTIDEVDLPQGVQARFVLSRSHPIAAGTMCKATVICGGYETREVETPLTPVGTSDSVPIDTVSLEPSRDTGGLRFLCHDRHGKPVNGPFPLVLEQVNAQRPLVVPVRFGRDGAGDPVALPIGRYEIRAAAKPGRTPIEGTEATVAAGSVADVPLRLGDIGGFEIRVEDERGSPVEDFGVNVALGHEPILPSAGIDGNAYVVRGIPVLVPGLGGAWRGQTVGYREGPVTIEIWRHGYRPARVFTEAKAGEIASVRIVLESDPASPWPNR